MITAYGLTDADRADIHARLTSWFGDDRQGLLLSHLAPVLDRIKAAAYAAGIAAGETRVVEMARTADHRPEWVKVTENEQGAEGDTWEVAVYREAPQARCEWCGQACGHENGCRLGLGPGERGAHRTDCNCAPPYADCRHPACDCTDCVYDCPGSCGDHLWLDRPESDTAVCDLCGAER